MTRFLKFHFRQLGSLFKEGFRGNLQPRRYGTAQIFRLFGDGAESGRRAEINDNQGTSILMYCCHSINNTVGAYLLWIIVFNDKAGFNA